PEVLVVDEALSVGDTIFQHRCVRRIKEMQAAGATILFVSHDPTLVRAICSRAILLHRGEMLADGEPKDVLNRYQRLIMSREEAYDDAHASHDDAATGATAEGDAARASTTRAASHVARAPLTYTYRHGNRHAEIVAAELLDGKGEPAELVDSGEPVSVRLRILFHRDVEHPVCGFMIRTRHGVNVYGTNTEHVGLALGAARAGDVIEATFSFNCWLGQEHYFVSVAAHTADGVAFDWLDGAIFFRVAWVTEFEGIANLNAQARARRLGDDDAAAPRQTESDRDAAPLAVG
ncbi:MAG: Wzt carbohydrate-binding domain-containing protein, partial [Acidobacteria bacterium]|nr:Wzt carbohydrate-binding domain-containing protein [Acidobacteriota bacterium]